MSRRRTLSRFLVLLVVLSTLTTCMTPRVAMQKPARGTVPPVPEKNAKVAVYSPESYSLTAPVIVVDTSGPVLAVHPDPATAYDTDGPGGPATRLWWQAPAGTDLTIRISPGCVRDLVCDNGVCSALALPVERAHRHCKYDVIVPGKPTLDPDAIIVKCCTNVMEP